MTNDQLEIFKLKARVLMLEHLLLDVAIQSLAALHRTTGRQSQQASVAELRATVKGLEKNLRKTFPEPGLTDAFFEGIEQTRSRILPTKDELLRSLRRGRA